MKIRFFFLLVAALLCSIIISDLAIAKVIKYPAYGVKYKVRYRKGGGKWTNIRKPHAKIFNVEGMTITSYNNLGVPGIDVDQIDNPVVILGSSYVEALQYEPKKIATSIFQEELNGMNIDRYVLNLGCSGHDPYDSWFRLKFFEYFHKIESQDVILVINSDYSSWFNRHAKPFDFNLPEDFGLINSNTITRAIISARNTSSFIEICANAIKSKKNDETEETRTDLKKDTGISNSNELSEEMKSCLSTFNDTYKNFGVISIVNDRTFNYALSKYCQNEDILHYVEPMIKPEYMIKGRGHLNEEGNAALGKLLFQAFTSSFHPQTKT